MIALRSEQLTSANPMAINIVLLHGWSFDQAIWQDLLPQLRQWANITLVNLPGSAPSSIEDSDHLDINSLIEGVLKVAPAQAVYIGWSLGGSLATQLAADHPGRVQALITLATNPCFVARHDWTVAMSEQDFKEFESTIESQQDAGLKRFDSLQCQGEESSRQLQRWLKLVRPKAYVNRDLVLSLQCLQQLDNREPLSAISCPVLHILGERDALVPSIVSESILKFNSAHEVMVISDASHQLLWGRSETLLAQWQNFLKKYAIC